MSTPINLNKVRKKKLLAAKRAQADTNAVLFGRTKAEKLTTSRENERVATELDGKVLDAPNPDQSSSAKDQ